MDKGNKCNTHSEPVIRSPASFLSKIGANDSDCFPCGITLSIHVHCSLLPQGLRASRCSIPQSKPGWSPSCHCDRPCWPESYERQRRARFKKMFRVSTWRSRTERCVDPNTNLSTLIDSYVENFYVPNLIIRFGTWKVRYLNRALVTNFPFEPLIKKQYWNCANSPWFLTLFLPVYLYYILLLSISFIWLSKDGNIFLKKRLVFCGIGKFQEGVLTFCTKWQ